MPKYIVLTGLATLAAVSLVPRESVANPEWKKRITCTFHDEWERKDKGDKGSVHCDTEAEICVRKDLSSEDPGQIAGGKPCHGYLRVRCEKPKGGYYVYDDGVLVGEKYEKLVLQGITSAENPFPPSIFLKREFRSGPSVLNAGGRTIRGECSIGSGSHD